MNQSRSSIGCWICRLRHKKCDKGTPTCGGCQTLELSCYYDEEKPEWMDNGPKQQEMAKKIKLEVKRGATRRRGRKRMQDIAREIGDDENFGCHSDFDADHVPNSELGTLSIPFRSPLSENEGFQHAGREDSSVVGLSPTRPSQRIFQTSEQSSSAQPADGHSVVRIASPGLGSLENLLQPKGEPGLKFIMSYLDYVFPVLFPFYQPSILQGGRSWLLVSIMNNNAMYHTVLGLTSFFFSVVPMLPGSAHQACASKTWEELQRQASLAVKRVQQESQEICHRGLQMSLRDSVDLMGNVVQLLGLQIIIAPTDDWQIHLDAASVLFEEIFDNHGLEGSVPSINKILNNLSDQIPVTSEIPLWNTAQAAFRFFSAMLLINDIISSTSLEQPPKLRKYHSHLLVSKTNSDQRIPLQLEDFVGCENWVLLLVCEITTLDAWKKDMKKAGSLSMMQLVQRASTIKQQLNEGLSRVESFEQRRRSSSKTSNPLEIFLNPLPDLSNHITRIWAYAAHTYLLITVSGWQPADPEVQEYVAKTIALFSNLPSPALLRTLVWPFCVIGCLATADQERIFRQMVASMDTLQNFGTMNVALEIMVKVWSRRTQIDAYSCDVAACLRIMGYPVLLV